MVLLAVKDAQGIGVQATLAVVAQMLLVARKVFHQGLPVLGTAIWASEIVHVQGKIRKTQLCHIVDEQRNDFSVRGRGIGAQKLAVHLMELAHAALLRALAAEHGTIGEKLGNAFPGVQAGAYVGTHDAGSRLRAQGLIHAVGVRKGVHFLLHHVCFRAYGAGKKLRILHDGHAHFLKAVCRKDAPACAFHEFEHAAVLVEHVRKTVYSLDAHTLLEKLGAVPFMKAQCKP